VRLDEILVESLSANRDGRDPGSAHAAAEHVAFGAIGQKVFPTTAEFVDSAVRAGARLLQSCENAIGFATIKHVFLLVISKRAPEVFIVEPDLMSEY